MMHAVFIGQRGFCCKPAEGIPLKRLEPVPPARHENETVLKVGRSVHRVFITYGPEKALSHLMRMREKDFVNQVDAEFLEKHLIKRQ